MILILLTMMLMINLTKMKKPLKQMNVCLIQITWFTALLSLDEKRRLEKRNSVLPCLQHEDKPPGPLCPATLPLCPTRSSPNDRHQASETRAGRCETRAESVETHSSSPSQSVLTRSAKVWDDVFVIDEYLKK